MGEIISKRLVVRVRAVSFKAAPASEPLLSAVGPYQYGRTGTQLVKQFDTKRH